MLKVVQLATRCLRWFVAYVGLFPRVSLFFLFRSSLEEYLQELGGVAPGQLQQQESQSSNEQLSHSEAVPNFAHAALILQNSSNVYSRKVEYLHSLVYKALYEFFKSTSGSNSKEARRKSTDAAIDEFHDFDPHEDFLLLDDMIPEDMTIHKINLKEDDDDQPLCTTPNQSLTRTRLSLGGLSVTRAERSSLGGGFASSSQQRALLGTLNNGSLRLVNGRCDVGEDGVLLMPGSSSQSSTKSVGEPEGRRSLFGDEAPMAMDLPVEQNDDYDEHSNDGPGFDMNDDEPESVAGENQAPEVIGITLQQQQEPTKRVTFQDVKPKRGDPWALLDPHSSEGNTQKPLRKGKTYRLPEGVDLPPSDCVTGASTRRIPQRRALPRRQEVKTCLAAEAFQAYLGNRGQPPKIPINGLVFGEEFAYIAKETAKKRASARRAERKKEQQEQTYGQPATYDDDEEEYGGGYDFGGDDDYDDENNDIGNAGMSSLDDAFQNAADSEGKQRTGFYVNSVPGQSLISLLTTLQSPTWARPLKSSVAHISKLLLKARKILL
jgi:condensin-2 complex subunit H2